MVNELLKLGFKMSNFSSLKRQTKLFLHKIDFYNDETPVIYNVTYHNGSLTDDDNGLQFLEINSVINYFDLNPSDLDKDFVYFLLKNDIFKIGRTNNIIRRFKEINQYNFEDIDFCYYFTTEQSKFHEQKLKQHYKPFQLKGEKFRFHNEHLNFFLDYRNKNN